MPLARTLEPEWLDELHPADARARRARRELQLVNALMGHASFIARALANSIAEAASIADLGAGDGALMLRIARKLGTRAVRLSLVDRACPPSPQALARFSALGWQVTPCSVDVFEWLAGASYFDAITVNLFLHHLEGPRLRELLRLAAARTRLFVACEPRRSRVALLGSRALLFLGCGPVTRHDAVLSVKAGFQGRELSELWPSRREWALEEGARGPFSHLFVARHA
jgi:hypothetical protein